MPAVTHWKVHTGTMWQFRRNNIAIIPCHIWEKNVFIRSVFLLSLFHQEALFMKYKHGESLLIGSRTHEVVHMAAKHRCGQGKALFSGLDVAASWKSNGWCLFAQGLNHFLPLETWNDNMASHPTICLNCVDRDVICVKRKLPSRRHGCPCLYYANSYTTFHLDWLVILFLSWILVPWVARYQQLFLGTRVSEITKALGDVIHGISSACSPTDLSLHFQSFCHCVYWMPDLLETKQRWLWASCVT